MKQKRVFFSIRFLLKKFKICSNNTPAQRPIAVNAVIGSNCSNSTNSSIVPVIEPPSYACTMAYKAAQQQPRQLPPPPPYTNKGNNISNDWLLNII